MQNAYPPGAPLPRFKITKVRGLPFSDYPGIEVEVEFEVTNFQELKDWFDPRLSEGSDIRTTEWRELAGNGGVTIHLADSGVPLSGNMDGAYYTTYLGAWHKIALEVVYGLGFQCQIDPSLYFCDVYIPFPSELPSGVWTDLQFRVAPTPSLNRTVEILAGAAVVAVGVGGAYYLWKRRRR